jgi:DNA-binding GntR family transcriptional regulator
MSQQRDILREHTELKDSTVARDPVAATRAIQDHIQRSTDSIIASKAPIFDDSNPVPESASA